MEAFACMINKACRLGDMEGFSLSGNGVIISHMLYVDDTLLLGTWSRKNIVMLSRLLRVFNMCSGMKFNVQKSFLFGLGVSNMEVSNLAETMGCKVGSFPFTYLGIKVAANMNRIAHWDPVIDTICNRLQSWKAKVLSIGGRLTLIKSVLASLPVYYLSLFKAPSQVLENIEKLMRKFLWIGSKEGKGIHLVSWNVVTKPKRFGGLGISKLSEVNSALLVKWAWRFKSDYQGLWKKSILSIHGGRNKWTFLPVNKACRGVWKSIVSLLGNIRFDGRRIDQLISCKLGDGSRVSFWKDIWVGTTPLWMRWPTLFKSETDKNAPVCNRIRMEGGNIRIFGDWMKGATPVTGISEAQDALFLLSDVNFSGSRDLWIWDDNHSDGFSVANVKAAMKKIFTINRFKECGGNIGFR
ncbi:uncharacterized protein LOC143590578 [Bidens hawaiensis]|uniref:uncharacterized protein LOC143590578 n=1 Tax=Bidens hawaiensis TaxID=980011 RepID=UPI00404943A0